MRIGQKRAFHGMGKAPRPARDYLPRAIGRVAHGEDVFRTGRIVDRITLSSSGAQQDMSQRHVVSFLGWRGIGANQAANLFSSWIMRNWNVATENLSLARGINLTAKPGNRVTFSRMKYVSDFSDWGC